MKHILTPLVAWIVAMTPAAAIAGGTAECALIRDNDSRMLCFATQSQNSSYCSFIKDADKRALCHVLVK